MSSFVFDAVGGSEAHQEAIDFRAAWAPLSLQVSVWATINPSLEGLGTLVAAAIGVGADPQPHSPSLCYEPIADPL